MNKSKKFGLLVTFSVIALLTVIFAVKIIRISQIKKDIPELPDLTAFPAPLKEQLSDARKKALQKPSCDNIGRMGMVFHSNAFYEEAIRCYRLAIERDPSKWEWRYYLGYIYKEMGDSKSVIDNFTTVTKVNPEVYLAWYYLGKAYQNSGSEEKAKEAYNTIAYLPDNLTTVKTLRINYSPVQSLARYELARIYLNSNKTDEAEKLLLDIIAFNHSIGPVYRLLGDVYNAKGDQDQGRKYVTRARDLSIITSIADTLVDKLPLLSRSELYLLRQIDDAIKSANPAWTEELIKHALQYLPDDKYLISKAVKFYLRMDIGKKALPLLNKHFNLFCDDQREILDVAELLYQKGFYPQSLPYFARAIKLKPGNNETVANYALSSWKDNRRDSAIVMMNELYEKNRNNSKVLANEVAFMIITGDKAKAMTFLDKFRHIAPKDAKVPKLAAMIAESEGNILKAIQLYEASFLLDPEDLETARKLGTLLINNDMWEKAVSHFRTALSYKPNEPYLLEKLGVLLVSCPDAKLRNLDEGLELSERAFFHISSPSNTMISAAKTMAQAYAIKGNFSEATRYIRIAISMAQEANAPEAFVESLKQFAVRIRSISQKK